MADSLAAASLLAYAGGLLDAFLYVAHGKVFAGAMTGNAILSGIALLGGDHAEILHHLLPIAAFLAGVWLAEMLQARAVRHGVTIGLAAEAGGLLLGALLPAYTSDNFFVFYIALLAAFQIASFRSADNQRYNSTFITGNLRSFTIGLFKSGRSETRAEGLRQARDLGSILVAFLLGALTGAALAHRLGNRTLLVPAAAVAAVLVMSLYRSSQASAKG